MTGIEIYLKAEALSVELGVTIDRALQIIVSQGLIELREAVVDVNAKLESIREDVRDACARDRG